MKVFVVMSNDFPDKVFATEEAADRYVKERMDDPKNRTPLDSNYGYGRPRIYYRHYEFEVLE